MKIYKFHYNSSSYDSTQEKIVAAKNAVEATEDMQRELNKHYATTEIVSMEKVCKVDVYYKTRPKKRV